MYSFQDEELVSWDEWGQNDSGLVSIKVETSGDNDQPETNKDVDLFGDMQPVFEKPKKVTLV